ncbi:MAG: hypothetical protein ACK5P1_10505, partial [Sphingobacteriia bacterium]
IKEGKNKPDEGLFGDVLAFCSAVEEQGRKVLHSHLLIWIRGWETVFQNLGSTCESTRKMFEDVLMNYASKIMTTKIFGKNSANKFSLWIKMPRTFEWSGWNE